MHLTFETIQKILEKYVYSVECVGTYGEPGYENPKQLILFANWNEVPRYIQNGLERRGYALEWDGEWIIDYETDRAYRTKPDCMSWTPSFYICHNGTIYGKDEWSAEDRIEYFINNSDELEPFDLDLESHEWYELDIDNTEIFNKWDNREQLLSHMNDHGLDVIFQNYSDGYIHIWLKSQADEKEHEPTCIS